MRVDDSENMSTPPCLVGRGSRSSHGKQCCASSKPFRLDEEIEGMVRWFNNEVVPSVRQHSSRALRTASEKLTQLADHMDDLKRK